MSEIPRRAWADVPRSVSLHDTAHVVPMPERALLNGIAANTDVMLVYLDTHFNFIWVNQAYATGCHVTRESLIGRNHFALYPDAENEATFRQVRDSGEPVFYKDKPFTFPDQPERGITYWDWSLAPDKDLLGRVIGLVFTLRETTQYVRAQRAVLESEQRFAALADAAPVLIWMSGPDKVCTWFNQQWLNFTGRTLAQELNGGWIEGLHPDDAERCVDTYNRAFDRRERFQMDYRQRAASGEYRWLSDRAAPHYSPNGEFIGYIGTCVDITERLLAEDALASAQAFAQDTIDAISAHLCVLDNTGRILAVNQAWRDFYDQNHPQPMSNNYCVGANYLQICDAAEQSEAETTLSMASGLRQVMAGESSVFKYEYPCHSPDEQRWFVATVTRFRGSSGNVVVAHENVTERKKAEDAVKAAQAEAEQANNAKSRFLAAASHDLRQPLSALSIYVGSLKDSIAPDDAPLIGNMSTCVASLSELLTDLLDMSKLDAGVINPVMSKFSVADLLTSLVAVHQPEAQLKDISLRARPSRLYARTDQVIYQRMVGNLLANAIRYTDRGGVLIACRRRLGKHWIEVWDTGVGIPPDKTGEIFEEFRQLDHDERNRGSGLGLAIVEKSAKLLGLEIRLQSRQGKGSMFALELPLGEQSPIAETPKRKIPRLHIAVVDDNLLVLNAMVAALLRLGHHITAASSGQELLEKLGEQAPDIVVSDFRLARGQSGFDVIEDTRAHFGEDLPALLITGDTDPGLIRSMADRGIVVQHKPLKIDSLLACIAQVTKH